MKAEQVNRALLTWRSEGGNLTTLCKFVALISGTLGTSPLGGGRCISLQAEQVSERNVRCLSLSNLFVAMRVAGVELLESKGSPPHSAQHTFIAKY